MDSQTDQQTYYDILHVQRSAPRAIIKNAYRALMMNMKLHPDLGGDTAQAAVINEAYEVLSDVTKREEYDLRLTQRETHSNADAKKTDSTQRAESNFSTHDFSQKKSQQRSTSNSSRNGTSCAFCGTTHNAMPGNVLDCGGCGSPMELPPNDLNNQDSARRIERISKDTDIEVWLAADRAPLAGRLRDLSPQGVGFVLYAKNNVADNQVVKISCSLFEGTAVIAHRRDLVSDVTMFGAKFITLRFHNQSGNFISARL